MVGFSVQADTVDVDTPSKSGMQSFMHSALDVHSQVNTLTFSKGSQCKEREQLVTEAGCQCWAP